MTEKLINTSQLLRGIRSILPIVPGIIPFGLIMGTSAQNAEISIIEMFLMNLIVLGGSSQLVAVDLMTKNVDTIIIILTGCVINLRMMLYSAAFSPLFKSSSFVEKTIASYMLTDQAYALTTANEDNLPNKREKISFYFGAAISMVIIWHISVILGMYFGNFAPKSLSLDFAVPLSFMALTIPAIKDKSYLYVAVISGVLSLFFYELPYNLGLLLSAGLGVASGAFISGSTEGVESAV